MGCLGALNSHKMISILSKRIRDQRMMNLL